MSAALATTPFGRVRGLIHTVSHHRPAPVDVAVFKGIPYATAERFEKPVSVTSLDPELGPEYDTVFDATTYRALCPVFGGILRACHGVDLPFVFHNLDRPGVGAFTGDGDDRTSVADEVSGAVLRFAFDGKPGWDPYDLGDRTTRRFDAEPETLLDPEPSLRELWAG